MKHTNKVEEPARMVEVITNITCDLCKEEIENKRYKINEVIIERKIGDNFPEGGNGKEMKIDMCGKCFDTKFISWVKQQGFTPKWEEWCW